MLGSLEAYAAWECDHRRAHDEAMTKFIADGSDPADAARQRAVIHRDGDVVDQMRQTGQDADHAAGRYDSHIAIVHTSKDVEVRLKALRHAEAKRLADEHVKALTRIGGR